jgi:enoyl-CoA hydratase/carnithine racemase
VSTVLYHRDGPIARITLNRPEASNSLTAEMGERLRAAWREAELDPVVAVVVLAGAGERAFCAGVDLGELDPDPAEQRDLTGFSGPATGLAKPMVAAVQGYALGAGCKLAMSADVIVASRDARFGYPEARVGVIGDADFVHRPIRQLPRREAMATLLTGRLLGAERARRLGAVTEVVAADDLLAAADRWASSLARR